MPLWRWLGSMVAKPVKKLACPALVIQRFCPVRRQWSPSRTMRLFMPATSEPASGSLQA